MSNKRKPEAEFDTQSKAKDILDLVRKEDCDVLPLLQEQSQNIITQAMDLAIEQWWNKACWFFLTDPKVGKKFLKMMLAAEQFPAVSIPESLPAIHEAMKNENLWDLCQSYEAVDFLFKLTDILPPRPGSAEVNMWWKEHNLEVI